MYHLPFAGQKQKKSKFESERSWVYTNQKREKKDQL